MFPFTRSDLRHVLNYDEKTGLFTWKNPSSRRVKVGDVAGTVVSGGVTQIGIFGRIYSSKRLAKFYLSDNDWDAAKADAKARNEAKPEANPVLHAHLAELAECKRKRALARTAARTAYRSELTRIEWEYLNMVKYLKQSERLVRKEREQHNFEALNKSSPHENPPPLPLAF